MRQPAARLKGIKGSVWVLQEPDTAQYIAFRCEHQAPRLAPLHLATVVPDRPECLAELQMLASRRLAGVRYELVRVDAL
jgi:hypothetical protein